MNPACRKPSENRTQVDTRRAPPPSPAPPPPSARRGGRAVPPRVRPATACALHAARPSDSRPLVRVASSRGGAGRYDWDGNEFRGWRRTMGAPGTHLYVGRGLPWSKGGGRRRWPR